MEPPRRNESTLRSALNRRIATITAQLRTAARGAADGERLPGRFSEVRDIIRTGARARSSAAERFVNGTRNTFERHFAETAQQSAPTADRSLLTEQRRRVRRLSTSVESTYVRRVERKIAALRREGKATRGAIRDLISQERGIAQRRATLIATDQRATIHAEHTQAAAREVELPRYIWRTQRDDRVRPHHREREGREFRWSRPPFDGHPGEAINCFPGDTRVVPLGVERIYRRWYEGELVVAHTEAGPIRGTPNHPVLTGRGWAPLKELQESDDIFHHVDHSVSAIESDRHKPTFAELWELADGMFSRRFLGGRFHGDASPQDEIDVIDINRDLRLRWNSSFAESTKKFCLTNPDCPATREGAGAFRVPGITLPAPRGLRGSNTHSALLSRHAGLHGEHGLRSVPGDVAFLGKPSENHVARHAALGGDGLHGFPGCIVTRKVIKISRGREFSGHVYNLQTNSGWYVASAVVVHNCRCFAEPVLPR